MNAKQSKKIGKKARRLMNAYLKDVKTWPLMDRLKFAWLIVKGDLWS